MADVTELYETRAKEFDTLSRIHGANEKFKELLKQSKTGKLDAGERAELNQISKANQTRPLTNPEVTTFTSWLRATARHEFLDAAKNTPAVKAEVLKSFQQIMAEEKAAAKPKRPKAKPAAPADDFKKSGTRARVFTPTAATQAGTSSPPASGTRRTAAEELPSLAAVGKEIGKAIGDKVWGFLGLNEAPKAPKPKASAPPKRRR